MENAQSEINMTEKEHIAECLLFVAGEPVAITELARVLELSVGETRLLLGNMEDARRDAGAGIGLLVTRDTAQLVSNRRYFDKVEALLQPDEKRSVSQSLMETLAVIAYRQPVTRADVENVRGVRCDYAVTQLLKMGLIVEVGRRDTLGHPTLFGTTDRFLHRFGIHSVEEMPDYSRFSNPIAEETEQLDV